MELGVSLGHRQEQRLLLQPRMLQAIEILQLSTRDLLSMIERELATNETLELGSQPPAESSASAVLEPDAWPRRSPGDEPDDMMRNVPAHSLSLHAHLLGQLSLLRLTPEVRETVSFLIGSLDGNGHFLLDDSEMVTCLGEGAPVAEALAVLRSLDPPGVGTNGPRESMLAQLDPGDPDSDYLAEIISEHLEDLAKNRLPLVARRLEVSVEDLKLLLGKLKGLDPCPGRAFEWDGPTRLEADVLVRREDGEWQVYVDDTRVPPLALSADYEALARDARAPHRVRSYLRGKLGSARDLLAAIQQRKETLARVARAVVDRQVGFLERGLPGLQPLKMQEIADAIGVHLSTVSRASAGKYIQTDFGVFPLRRVFDGGKAVGTAPDGSGGASRVSAQQVLRRLIEAEDPAAPLSDEDLVHKLEQRGLELARRTVAKYRNELGIPSSWRRKKH